MDEMDQLEIANKILTELYKILDNWANCYVDKSYGDTLREVYNIVEEWYNEMD